MLTGYDGKTITYDTIGNPLSDGTWTYTWEHGRELASMSDGSTTWSYEYNADGLWTKRTNGSTTYSYIYNGSSLSRMTVGSNTLYFAYDATGTPMSVTYNGTNYYYVTNIQGDITAILNTSGTAVVQYTYDAWGNILTTTGSMASTLGETNPLRYRGYVYDRETRLYYLQSRYYDPTIGRFLNADNYPTTGQGLTGNNMFAYCGNNPVSREDTGGEFWHIIAGAAIGAVVSFASSVVGDLIAGEEVDWAGAGISAAFGAVSGALAATSCGVITQVAGGAILAGAENVIEQGREKGYDKIDYGVVAVNAIIGGISSCSNGVSKATSKHLHKQAAVATKRIVNSAIHDTIPNIGKTLISSAKYYFSQTKTLFYTPLLSDAVDSFVDSLKDPILGWMAVEAS